MRALPFGVPKFMISTLASGQVKPFVGVRDIAMLNSVVDISGLNRIRRTVLANAAKAEVIAQAVRENEAELPGSFAVVAPDSIRLRRSGGA